MPMGADKVAVTLRGGPYDGRVIELENFNCFGALLIQDEHGDQHSYDAVRLGVPIYRYEVPGEPIRFPLPPI